MELAEILARADFLWSPLTAAALSTMAIVLVWMAFVPASSLRNVRDRLGDYTREQDVVEEVEMRRSVWKRVFLPFLRRVLRALSVLSPTRNVEVTERKLVRAGEPFGMTVADFFGLQVISAVFWSVAFYLLVGRNQPLFVGIRNALFLLVVGFFLPRIWLQLRINQRKNEITKTFSDALDILSVGVEAGLAFESALLRVCERWDNALTREFYRTVVEMRMGTPRRIALQRLADRTGVQELQTFVAVLIQSSELGVSISSVLHTQAAQLRTKRRQRAEELARQAGVKMVIPLVFLVFPALLIVLLGPGLPQLFDVLSSIGGQ